MPSARSASSAARSSSRSARPHPRPRGLAARGPVSGIRWDRLGRIALLAVFVLVAGIGVQGARSYLSTHAQAEQQISVVQNLQRQNRKLSQLQRSLQNPQTIVLDARALGMVGAGEQSFAVTGLPNH
jgi:cell division protein FtsB